MKLVDRYTGEVTTVYLFVSCLSYSRYAYVEPTLDMKMDTWMRCHIRMYEAFCGVPVRTVCGNLKTGVVKHPKHYPNSRFEDACRIALNNTTSPRYKYLKALLSNNQDILERERASKRQLQENHSIAEEQSAYVRGASYYGGGDHHDQ